jgi:hypothetical protein
MPEDLRQSLLQALSSFTGSETTILGEAEAAYAEQPGYLDCLLTLIPSPEEALSAGATRLLKSAFEKGHTLDARQLAGLIIALPAIRAWQAKLHICQSVQYLALTPDLATALADWAEPLLSHKRPFLRAWSLSAYVTAAQAESGLADKARAHLGNADMDDAASVKARARALRKLYPSLS